MAMIWAIAMCINKLYISKRENAIEVPIDYVHVWGKAEALALIDSGATESFINYWTAIHWRLPTWKLQYAQEIVNADGTENKNKTITEAYILWVQQGGKAILEKFYITNLG